MSLRHIAIVHTYAAQAGLERRDFDSITRDRALATFLEELLPGVEVRGFGCTLGDEAVHLEADRYAGWTYLPVDPRDRAAIFDARVSAELLDRVASWAADIVLVKGIGTALSAAVLARLPAVPVVAIIGGRYAVPELGGYELVLTETDAQDRHVRRSLGPSGSLRLPKLVHEAFDQASAPYDPDDCDLDLTYIGDFFGWKNHDALLPFRDLPVRMALLGDGSERARITTAFEGSVGDVWLPGEIPAAEVADTLRRTRLLVHPSRSEGFPRSVAEAMSLGRPVVAIRGVVGAPVVDGVNGLLVTESELVGSVMGLLGDRPRLRRMGEAARRTAEAEFSPAALRTCAVALAPRLAAAVVGYPTRDRTDLRRRARAWLADRPRALRHAAASVRRRVRR